MSNNQNHPELSIIIVNWNSWQFTVDCVTSLRSLSNMPTYEIIIADNSSSSPPPDTLLRDQSIKLLLFNENYGFGTANNLAAEKSKGSILLFLNPDTLINSSSSITKPLSFLQSNPDAGCVGVQCKRNDGKPCFDCARNKPTLFNQILNITMADRLLEVFGVSGLFNLTGSHINNDIDVALVSGAYMMIPKETFNSINGFKSSFFLYGEDVDMLLRISSAGKRIFYMGSCSIIHHMSQSSKLKPIRDITTYQFSACHSILETLYGQRQARLFAIVLVAILPVLIVFAPIRDVFLLLSGRRKHYAETVKYWYGLCWAVSRIRS